MAALSILLLSTNYLTLPPLASSVILSLLNVVSYLSSTYDNVLIGAVVPAQIVGFTFAVQGLSMQILGLIPVAVSLIKMPSWVTITILNVYTGGVILYTIWFVRYRKRGLIELDDPKQERSDGNWFLTMLLGYNTEKKT